MRVKDLTQSALLVGIGFILHAIFPPIVMGMKPDFSLAMMFIVLIIKKDFKLGFLVAIATGIFTALTTGFPGGQIPNIVDKLLTWLIVSALIYLLGERISNKKFFVSLITVIGTLISGGVFLGSAALIVGLPGPFSILYSTVVIPAAVINTITALIIYISIEYSIRGRERSKSSI
jgi:hypothetical protein